MNHTYLKAARIRPWLEWALFGGVAGVLFGMALGEYLMHWTYGCIHLLPASVRVPCPSLFAPAWHVVTAGQGFVFGCAAAIGLRMICWRRTKEADG